MAGEGRRGVVAVAGGGVGRGIRRAVPSEVAGLGVVFVSVLVIVLATLRARLG